jgi:hypothetical protein
MNDMEILSYTFQERFNQKEANKIINNFDKIISQLPEERQKKIKNKMREFDPLNALKKIVKSKDGINQVKYKFSKSSKTYGRLFANSASLQGLPKEFRATLANGLYYDIDFVNCHPSILEQYCIKNGIKCNNLSNYNRNRDDIIKKIMSDLDYTRNDVKDLFLSLINGGNREGLVATHELIRDFKNEMTSIHNLIVQINPKILKQVKRCFDETEPNINGKVVNRILCDIENSLLLNAVKILIDKNYNIDCLIFDGFLIRIEEGKIVSIELLEEVSNYVNQKTGYKLKLAIKEFENIIDLSQFNDPEDDIDELNNQITYYKIKSDFEKNHCKIIHPPIYISKIKGKYILQDRKDLVKSYEDIQATIVKTVNKKPVTDNVSFIDTWLKDCNKKRHGGMTFTPPPLIADDSDFNTWLDFEIKSVELPDDYNPETNIYVKRFREFVYNLLNEKENVVNYMLSWIANMLQKPAKRSTVCIILFSIVEGIGKSQLIDLIARLVGENYYFSISDVANQLFGKHSMAEYQRLFISLNEVNGKATYSNTDVFKQRITDSARDFEPKGLSSFNSVNYCNYIIASNNINVVNITEKDRRFSIFTCKNKKMNDKQYFQDFQDEIINNPEAIRCIFEYLIEFPVEEYVPNRLFQNYRPSGDSLYEDLKEYNRDIVEDFVIYFIKRHHCENDNYKVGNKTLWEAFQSFLSYNGESKKIDNITSKKFHFSFKQKVVQNINSDVDYENAIIYSTKEKRIYCKGDDCYVFNIPLLKKYYKIDEVMFLDE